MTETKLPTPDFSWFTQENIQRLEAKLKEYLNTPSYSVLKGEDLKNFKENYSFENNPEADALRKKVNADLENLQYENDYLGRNQVIDSALDEVSTLTEGQQPAARRVLLFKKAKNLELHATFALKDRPLSDPERKSYFLQAVEGYIDADIKTCGLVSDYGLRVAESLGGAELPDLSGAILGKVLGGDITIYSEGDEAGEILVRGLKKYSQGQIDTVAKVDLISFPKDPIN